VLIQIATKILLVGSSPTAGEKYQKSVGNYLSDMTSNSQTDKRTR